MDTADKLLHGVTARQQALAWALHNDAGLCGPCSYETSVAYFSATIRTHLCHDCKNKRLAAREVIENRNAARRAAGEEAQHGEDR